MTDTAGSNMDQMAANIILLITLAILFILARWLVHYLLWREKEVRLKAHPLVRASCNPIATPDAEVDWQSEGTFNPAAILDTEGTVHLLYRAIGSDGVSRLGYMVSKDGIHFSKPVPYPVYESYQKNTRGPWAFDPGLFTSGGGWNGCEDPRAVVIDGTVYMTYVAFGGWHSIRIGLTSIALEDLKARKWNWQTEQLISPEGQAHKNWMLFPEKINGKFALLHCISPEILIKYVDDLDELTLGPVESRPPHDEHRNYFGRPEYWDNSVRSAGPPPIKTKHGWLLLYHSMDKRDPNKYKLGAMLLDLDEPTRVLYRSPLPILSPDMHYENNYKPGVIYASGAVVKDNVLHVYYGGGDRHLCVATTPLRKLVSWLITHGAN